MTKQEAVDFYGSQVALAAALGLHQSSVCTWGEHPPAMRQIQIEHLTGGKLKADPGCLQPKPKAEKVA